MLIPGEKPVKTAIIDQVAQKPTVVVALEVVVIDVAVTEAEGGSARVQVLPVVAVECHGDSGVLSSVAVRVTDKRCLPVVMEVAVCHSDTCAAMGNVEDTVITMKPSEQVRETGTWQEHTSPCRDHGRWRGRSDRPKRCARTEYQWRLPR